MCTNNGERYLREQLDSILAQTYTDWRLYIRDDNSTDNTGDIVREYVSGHPDKIYEVHALEHLGYPDCFWDILKRCPEADHYAFCDQDDVWMNNRLESAVNRLSSQPSINSPVLYIHDYENCDRNLNVMSVHRLGSVDVLTDRSILFYVYASGFCMIINQEMRKVLNGLALIGKTMYHDELCIWIAHFFGNIVYDERILVKYRRHEATVTKYGNGIRILISNWACLEIHGNEFDGKCERIRLFLELCEDIDNESISPGTRDEWLFLSGTCKNVPGYFKRLFYHHRLKSTKGGELALRLLFLLNKGALH